MPSHLFTWDNVETFFEKTQAELLILSKTKVFEMDRNLSFFHNKKAATDAFFLFEKHFFYAF